MGIAGAKISGYDTDREAFIGSYRTYANPEVVEAGACKGTLASGDNPCGTLQVVIELAHLPGREPYPPKEEMRSDCRWEFYSAGLAAGWQQD